MTHISFFLFSFSFTFFLFFSTCFYSFVQWHCGLWEIQHIRPTNVRIAYIKEKLTLIFLKVVRGVIGILWRFKARLSSVIRYIYIGLGIGILWRFKANCLWWELQIWMRLYEAFQKKAIRSHPSKKKMVSTCTIIYSFLYLSILLARRWGS